MHYYDSIALSYPALHHEEQMRKLNRIIPYLSKGSSLLDVGCGAGVSSFFGKVVGIDPSLELLKQCPYPCTQGVAEHLPFKDNSFDALICMTACHHFTDMGLALSEMERTVRHTIIISVLKRSQNFSSCANSIRQHFAVRGELDDPHDVILICSKKQRL